MSMGVHHDNFDLWNSKHNRWNAVNMGPKKDIVACSAKPLHDEGLKFGVSEHLWITYKWFSTSHGTTKQVLMPACTYDGADPKILRSLSSTPMKCRHEARLARRRVFRNGGSALVPAHQRFRRPLPARSSLYRRSPSLRRIRPELVAHLYNSSAKRERRQNEAVYTSKREEDSEKGTCVLDLERGLVDKIWPHPWQTDTCIGNWHYKRGQQYKSPKTVVDLLVDIVSRNGNLMLNFPLPASGQSDVQELAVLSGITKWMGVNSEAIYATRPWKIFGESPVAETPTAQSASFNERNRKDLTAADVRFTTKGDTLYAFVMGWPEYQAVIRPLASNTGLRVGKIQNVELLGFDGKLQWSQDDSALKVMVPAQKPGDYAFVFKVTGALSA